MNKEQQWIYRFSRLAREVSTWSKDPSTKVGAVVVRNNRILSTGYNGLPRGIESSDIPEMHKYDLYEHSERNAIYNATLNGVSLEGSTLFLYPWTPCADCARAIIQSGIKRVIVPIFDDATLLDPLSNFYGGRLNKWFRSFDNAVVMLGLARVELKAAYITDLQGSPTQINLHSLNCVSDLFRVPSSLRASIRNILIKGSKDFVLAYCDEEGRKNLSTVSKVLGAEVNHYTVRRYPSPSSELALVTFAEPATGYDYTIRLSTENLNTVATMVVSL